MNPNELVEAGVQESSVFQTEIVLVLGLLLIAIVAIFTGKVRFPYTVALVIVGLCLAILPTTPIIDLEATDQLITGEIILALFVPPLVFEGALRINWQTLRNNLLPVLLMALLGVMVSTFIVGGVVYWMDTSLYALADRWPFPGSSELRQIPFIAALAFGALISATDPVAVIAFFRRLGVGKRLSVLMEGESLLNDGTSIVIFGLMMTLGGVVVGSGGEVTAETGIFAIIWRFIYVAVGGVLVGLVVAVVADYIFLRPLDDRLIETTITLPLVFGSYIIAEHLLHVSGILAVVAAGIYIGNRIPVITNPATKIALYNFWEVIAFIFTSLIFLIIGWQINIQQLITPQSLLLVGAAVIAILLARFLVVYGIAWVSRLLGQEVPLPYQHIMFWGGLRGAISLALALSLSANTFGMGVGAQLQVMTFGVVLFTLLVQGTTIERLIKRLGLAARTARQVEREMALGRFFAAREAQRELNRLHDSGIVSGSIWEAMAEAQHTELAERDRELRQMLERYPGLAMELALQARQDMLRAERTALGEAARRDVISEELQEKMIEDVDARSEMVEQISKMMDQTPDFDLPTEAKDE
jgi:CPA1 family monovalent cation:H+ antiporter